MSMNSSSGKDPQITQFAQDLDKLVDRYRYEYDLSYAAVIGTLQMKCWSLSYEVDGPQSEGEDADAGQQV